MTHSPTPTACASANSKASSAKKAATPPKPTPPSSSTASAWKAHFTNARWANSRAAKKSACFSRKRSSAIRRRLLLDEPTNNLDLDSVHWLQNYLLEYEGVLIVISHDRHFLNSVCTHTADIDYETVIMYNGGYDDMVMAKTQIRSRIETDNANREKKIAQLNDFIARFSAGTRSAQATSRKKEVERLQTTELARSNIARPYIRFAIERDSGRHPLEIKSIAKSYDDLKVIKPFTASVSRGEKIALTGRNGTGKTTLLKSLIRNAEGFIDDADKVFPHRWRQREMGPRSHRRLFSAGSSRLRRFRLHRHRMALAVQSPIHPGRNPRPAGSDVIQRGRRAQAHQSAFSGGEIARMIFCRLMLQKPNFLVLDEPTNHLDLESINALNIALQRYDGTVLLVTHDEDVLDEVATRIWHFKNGKIEDFKGPYSDYLIMSRKKPRKQTTGVTLSSWNMSFRIRRFFQAGEEPAFCRVDRQHELTCWLF